MQWYFSPTSTYPCFSAVVPLVLVVLSQSSRLHLSFPLTGPSESMGTWENPGNFHRKFWFFPVIICFIQKKIAWVLVKWRLYPHHIFQTSLRPCLEYSGMGQMGKPANGLRHMTSQKKNVLRTSWLALNITICIEHVDMYCTITIFSGQTGQWFGRPLLLLYNTWHQTAAANRRPAAGPFKIASKFKIWIVGWTFKLK